MEGAAREAAGRDGRGDGLKRIKCKKLCKKIKTKRNLILRKCFAFYSSEASFFLLFLKINEAHARVASR